MEDLSPNYNLFFRSNNLKDEIEVFIYNKNNGTLNSKFQVLSLDGLTY